MDTFTLLLTSPTPNVIAIGLESKSLPDPITVHKSLVHTLCYLLMYLLPVADTGDCSEGVTTTSIGVVDDPPDIITTTSTCPVDSEPTNSSDPNSTLNSTHHIAHNILF